MAYIDLTNVDTALFKRQRNTLHEVIGNIVVKDAKTEEVADHLTGLESLLDHIYDELVPLVTCTLCTEQCDANTAHLHQGKWIGDECCWDERLRSSE